MQWAMTATLLCGVIVFTSCSSDNDDDPVVHPDEPQQQLADYTVIYYGHGGGNLDMQLMSNLMQFYFGDDESYRNVSVAVQYKFSSLESMQSLYEQYVGMLGHYFEPGTPDYEEGLKELELFKSYYPFAGKTARFVVDREKAFISGDEDGEVPSEPDMSAFIGPDNADITRTDSLTNFINWAAQTCPARKYILVLSDHGGGYLPNDEVSDAADADARKTRGVVYDDGYDGRHFTAKTLTQAIRQSSVRPSVVYLDACLMNTLEYLFELKDLTDYIVASTFNSYAGPPYDTFIECLSAASDNLKYALEKYIEYDAKHFDELAKMDHLDIFYNDITVTETARLNKLGKVMREFTDRLCDTYKNGTAEQKQKINDVTKNAVKISKDNPSYDIGRYMEGMRKALPEVFDDAFWTDLKSAFNNCIAAQYASQYLLDHDYQVDYSVLMARKGVYQRTTWTSGTESMILYDLSNYHPDGKLTTYLVENGEFKADFVPDYQLKVESEGQWGGTLESVYGALAFDKATGWSRWLMLNEQQPSLWCNNDFKTPLPDSSE